MHIFTNIVHLNGYNRLGATGTAIKRSSLQCYVEKGPYISLYVRTILFTNVGVFPKKSLYIWWKRYRHMITKSVNNSVTVATASIVMRECILKISYKQPKTSMKIRLPIFYRRWSFNIFLTMNGRCFINKMGKCHKGNIFYAIRTLMMTCTAKRLSSDSKFLWRRNIFINIWPIFSLKKEHHLFVERNKAIMR